MGTNHSAQAVHIHASPASDQRPPSADNATLRNVSQNETDSHTSLIPPSQLRGLSGRGAGGRAVRGQKYLLSLDRNMKVFLRASNLPGLEYRLRLAGYRTFHDLLSTNRETLEARGFTGIMAQRLMNAVSEYIERQVYRTEEERLPFRLVRRGQRLHNEPSESMKENPNYRKQNLKRNKSLGETPTNKHSNINPAVGGGTTGVLRNVVQLPSQVRLMNESDLEIQHLISPPPLLSIQPNTPPEEISSVVVNTTSGEDGDDSEAQELGTVVDDSVTGEGSASGDTVGGNCDTGKGSASGDNVTGEGSSSGGDGASGDIVCGEGSASGDIVAGDGDTSANEGGGSASGDNDVGSDNLGSGEIGDNRSGAGDNELVTSASESAACADYNPSDAADTGTSGDVNTTVESSTNKVPSEDNSGQKVLGVMVKHDQQHSLLQKESSQPSQPLEDVAHSLNNIITPPEDTDSPANHGNFASRFSRCFSVPADFDLTVDEQTSHLIFEECLVVSRVRAFSCPSSPCSSSPSFSSSLTDNLHQRDTQHTTTTPLYIYSWHTL